MILYENWEIGFKSILKSILSVSAELEMLPPAVNSVDLQPEVRSSGFSDLNKSEEVFTLSSTIDTRKGEKMARRVFFSFHYQRDIWRVNQIRNIPEITGSAAAGFQDASLWEEARKKGDAAIKKLIDEGLKNTSVTVVFIGYKTAGRRYINYEIQQSLARGNGLVGIQINQLKNQDGEVDPVGETPKQIEANGFKVYKYVDSEKLAKRIEEAAKIAGK